MSPDPEPGGSEAPRPPRATRPPPPPGTVTIRCRLDGPLVVECAPDIAEAGVRVRVTDETGRELPPPDPARPAALCRCGGSAARPWCDGSHRFNGWRTAPPPPQDGPGGPA